jgi:hypothetical protein
MWLQDGRVRRYWFGRKRNLPEKKKNEKTEKYKQHYADKPEAAHGVLAGSCERKTYCQYSTKIQKIQPVSRG